MIEQRFEMGYPPESTVNDLTVFVPDGRGWVDVFVSIPLKSVSYLAEGGVYRPIGKAVKSQVMFKLRRLVDPAVRTWGDA